MTARWTSMDVAGILGNPVYSFGICLEPQDETFFWIQAFTRTLPEQFWKLEPARQEDIFAAYIEWIARNDYVKIVQRNAETIIPKSEWILAQKRLTCEIIPLPDNWSFMLDRVSGYIEAGGIR
jgi:hypothetical protein